MVTETKESRIVDKGEIIYSSLFSVCSVSGGKYQLSGVRRELKVTHEVGIGGRSSSRGCSPPSPPALLPTADLTLWPLGLTCSSLRPASHLPHPRQPSALYQPWLVASSLTPDCSHSLIFLALALSLLQ